MSYYKIKNFFDCKTQGIVYQIDSDDPLLKERIEGYFIFNNTSEEEKLFFVSKDELVDAIYDVQETIKEYSDTNEELKKECEDLKDTIEDLKDKSYDLVEDILNTIINDLKINDENFDESLIEKNWYLRKFKKELK